MSQPRLLIIDDDEPTGTLFARIAAKEGYEALACQSAEAAKTQLPVFDPHVIVLDLIMPDTDGIEMAKWLTGIGFRGRVVVVSGYSDSYLDAAVAMLKARGVKDSLALSKPVDVTELRQALADPPELPDSSQLS